MPGVIDTLGLGFAALVGRPLALVPLLILDFVILFSPRITLRPVGRPVASFAEGRGAGWGVMRSTAERATDTNLIALISLPFPVIRTPSFATGLSQERLSSFPWNVSYSSLPAPMLIALAPLAIVTGLVASVLVRMVLAAGCLGNGVARDTVSLRLVARITLRFVGVVVALVGMFALVAMPVIVVTGIGMILGFGGSQLLWLIMLIPVAWGFVHFFFSIHALIVDQSGPFESLRSSYLVVRENFWQSVQFIATTMLIVTGLSFALRQMASNAGGVIIATVVNSFVAAGIIVAAMLFYRDRSRLLGVTGYIPGK